MGTIETTVTLPDVENNHVDNNNEEVKEQPQQPQEDGQQVDNPTTNIDNGDHQQEPPSQDPQPTAEEEATKTYQEATKAEEEAKKALSDAGLSFDDAAAEYERDGKLSERTYQDLEKAGFGRSLVDAYIAGVEARSNAVANTIMNSVGGQQNYNKIANYIAAKGDACIDAYNNLVEQGNVSAISMFLNGIQAEMTLNQGTANRTILGGQVGSGASVGGFANEAEMTKAMADPRYDTDPAYRSEVTQKLRNSNFFSFSR